MNQDRQDALTLLRDLYLDDDTGFIEVRAIYPDGRRHRDWRKTVKGAVNWVDSRDEFRSGPALHFGICKRKSAGVDDEGDELKPKGGGKRDILAVPAIWAEIDTDKAGLEGAAVIAELSRLPSKLRPSALVHSGHGYHGYWYLEDPVLMTPENMNDVERINRLVQHTLGSDPIQDVSRVFRVPTTWNNKNANEPVRSRLIWSERDRRFALDRIAEEWGEVGERVSECLPSLLLPIRRLVVPEQHTPNRSPTHSWSQQPSVSREELRERTRYHGGPGYFGIDEASARMVAKYHHEGYPDDWAIQRTVEFARSVQERDAPNERWDWRSERDKVAYQLERWKPKWAALRAREELERKAARKQARQTANQSATSY